MKKLELRSVYCLSQEEMDELYLKEGEEYQLFEGDPDWMDEPIEVDGMIGFNRVYFFIRRDRNCVIVSEEPEFKDELLEFCNGQDTKVSISGTCTRTSTEHWKYMDYGDNARQSYKDNKNLKIAYRGGCGYAYSLFEYKENDE